VPKLNQWGQPQQNEAETHFKASLCAYDGEVSFCRDNAEAARQHSTAREGDRT
jgi:hypothetical protein